MTFGRKRNVARSFVTAAVVTVGATVAMAAPAGATLDGSCDYRDFCLYWGSNVTGSLADYQFARKDFADDRFAGPGAGQGSRVKNNAASAVNLEFYTARVYYNEYYTGPFDDVPPNTARNLFHTWNDNASFDFRW